MSCSETTQSGAELPALQCHKEMTLVTDHNVSHPPGPADFEAWLNYVADPRIDGADALVRLGEACKYEGLVQRLMAVGRSRRPETNS